MIKCKIKPQRIMKTTYFLIFIIIPILAFTSTIKAQVDQSKEKPRKGSCPMTLKPAEIEAYRNSIKDEQINGNANRDGTFNLPVQFHLVRTSAGTGGITAEDAAWELEQANAKYAWIGIEFFQCSPPNFIDDDFYFNTIFLSDQDNFCGQTNAEYQIAGDFNVDNVINLYYVNTDGWNWSSFPSYRFDYCKDWIILNIGDTGTATLLAHELGHYFNLLHTFQGYGNEETGDEENITRNSEDECYNCPDHGDYLCDTPADNNRWNDACNWDGTGYDPCSYLDFEPEAGNIMSYSDCPNYFTSGQALRMIDCVLSSRSYLDCPFLSDCQSTWNLSSDQNNTFTFQASNTITSTADINNGAVSAYDAGNSITLQPGFHAKAGSTFNAFIDGCWGPVIFK